MLCKHFTAFNKKQRYSRVKECITVFYRHYWAVFFKIYSYVKEKITQKWLIM